MDVGKAEAFLAVAQMGSMSAAAKELYLTQSTLSYRIQTLENELGSKLFYRRQGGKSIQLTDSGREFYPIANRLVEANREASRFSQRLFSDQQTMLIGGLDSLNTTPFPEIYLDLHNRFPKISFYIKTFWYYEIYRMLDTRELDIGFVSRVMSARDVEIIPLFSEKMYLIHRRDSTRHAKASSSAGLDSSEALWLDYNNEFGTWFEATYGERAKQASFSTDKITLIARLIAECDFWAFAPATIARWFSAQGLATREVAGCPPPRTVYLLKRKDQNSRRPIVDEVQDYFVERLRRIDFGRYQVEMM